MHCLLNRNQSIERLYKAIKIHLLALLALSQSSPNDGFPYPFIYVNK